MDMNTYQHEMILCIVNSGFSEAVMDAAREAGARGGTVVRGRGTANADAEQYFEIPVQPEKEMVMILVEKEKKDAILRALYKSVGLKTPGQGIAFAVPVEDVVGLADPSADNENKEDSSGK